MTVNRAGIVRHAVSVHLMVFFAALALMAAAFGPRSAAAQTASEITPSEFTPRLQQLGGRIEFTGQPGTQAPPGSEEIGITLSGVTLENALPQMAQANAAFTARLTRGRIPVSELFDATADLEAAYAEAGYVLSRVVLPEQTLRDGGRLRVVVVNGYVEQIETEGVDEAVRRRVEILTSRLINRPSLTRDELERQLLLAGDVPGTVLRSGLAAGSATGTTVIGMESEFRPVTGFVGFGNPFGSDLGHLNLDFGLEFNSPLRLGETFYLRAAGNPKGYFTNDPRSRILAFGGVMPVGSAGTSVNLEFTFSDTSPDGTPKTRSDFDRQSLRVFRPLRRSRDMNLTAQISLDLQQDEQELVGVAPLFRDRLTILRGGLSGDMLHEDGAFSQATLLVSQGVDAFGARSAADAAGSLVPLSRAGADATFTKLTGGFQHRRPLAQSLSLMIAGRFQIAFGDALPTSEQFSLIGSNEFSTFDSGTLQGDSGWVLRSELSRRFEVQGEGFPLTLSPYLFAGAGMAHLENPTAVEQGQTEAFTYGLGVDVILQTQSIFRAAELRIEYGRGERDDALPDEDRFSISGSYRF